MLSVYQSGLDTGNASFETTASDWTTWDAGHTPAHRFVALDQHGQVAGWVAATPVSSRCVYAGVLEHSVYVRPDRQARGIGTALLDAYIAATEAADIWTLQTGTFRRTTPAWPCINGPASGSSATAERIGQHHGRRCDVVFIQRRSARTTDMLPNLPPSPRRDPCGPWQAASRDQRSRAGAGHRGCPR